MEKITSESSALFFDRGSVRLTKHLNMDDPLMVIHIDNEAVVLEMDDLLQLVKHQKERIGERNRQFLEEQR